MATLDEINAKLDRILAIIEKPRATTATEALRGVEGAVFGGYGKSAGRPVRGATESDLKFYRRGCLRTLGDAGKAKYHAKERDLLAAIEAELKRNGWEVDDGEAPASRPARASDRFPGQDFGGGSDDGGIPF